MTSIDCLGVIRRIREIRDEMFSLVNEAKDLLGQIDPEEAHLADRGGWYSRIVTAITRDHEYPSVRTHTLDDTLRELDSDEGVRDDV